MKIICTIFAVGIKDLEMRLKNTILQMEKSAICLKSLAQKETNKQMAVHYRINNKSLFKKAYICLRKT